jgi:hypothetical protein
MTEMNNAFDWLISRLDTAKRNQWEAETELWFEARQPKSQQDHILKISKVLEVHSCNPS